MLAKVELRRYCAPPDRTVIASVQRSIFLKPARVDDASTVTIGVDKENSSCRRLEHQR
jgi:hypothetical protein